jgi:hypothetical protein
MDIFGNDKIVHMIFAKVDELSAELYDFKGKEFIYDATTRGELLEKIDDVRIKRTMNDDNFDFEGKRLTNLHAATHKNDAVTRGQLDNKLKSLTMLKKTPDDNIDCEGRRMIDIHKPIDRYDAVNLAFFILTRYT